MGFCFFQSIEAIFSDWDEADLQDLLLQLADKYLIVGKK